MNQSTPWLTRGTARYHGAIGPEFSRIYQDEDMAFLGMSHLPVILGLTGPSKAGKTMVAKHLVTELGFHYDSLASFLREKAALLGVQSPTWELMRDLALRWRRDEGPAILFRMLFGRLLRSGTIRAGQPIVIDGVLHPAEAKMLLSLPTGVLAAIEADRGLRFRMAQDWFPTDKALDWDEFVRRDAWELGESPSGDARPPEAPNVRQCIDLTPPENRFTFDGKESQLLAKTREFVGSLSTRLR